MQKMDQEILPEDILKCLKDKKLFVAKTLNLWPPLRLRLLYFMGLMGGYFSIKEYLQLLLPATISKSKRDLQHLHHRIFVNKEVKRETSDFLSADGYFNLLGNKFGGLNYYETIGLINEVILLDQYHAEHFLKKDSVVIDAGANIGTFSIFAAKFATNGHVYAFEPVMKTFKLLKNNAKNYSNIACVHSGLGDVATRKNIVVRTGETASSVLKDSPFFKYFDNDADKIEQVAVTTIDHFVANNNVSRLDFIKIDTEGYEEKILQGAKKTIKKYKPVIAMSAYHNPDDKENLPRVLKKICPDYICELYKDHEEDFICRVK